MTKTFWTLCGAMIIVITVLTSQAISDTITSDVWKDINGKWGSTIRVKAWWHLKEQYMISNITITKEGCHMSPWVKETKS